MPSLPLPISVKLIELSLGGMPKFAVTLVLQSALTIHCILQIIKKLKKMECPWKPSLSITIIYRWDTFIILYYILQAIPAPTRHLVTHWGGEGWSGMAYSYLPVGADGGLYDVMAEEVHGKVHFAGEVSNFLFLFWAALVSWPVYPTWWAICDWWSVVDDFKFWLNQWGCKSSVFILVYGDFVFGVEAEILCIFRSIWNGFRLRQAWLQEHFEEDKYYAIKIRTSNN